MPLAPMVDRNPETALLEDAWRRAAEGSPQLAMVWGRRRVGKTFLLAHFVAGKRSVFFGATQQSQSVELARLAETVRRDLGSQVADLAGGAFSSWEAALRFFSALAADQPLVVVLDEVPYLTRSTRGWPSIVQAVWDHLEPGIKLLLVLTGSAVGTIEDMLGARGALRGRPTLSMRVDPVELTEARAFLPSLEPAAFVEAYAACGGYPLHLTEWDEGASTFDNLVRLAGTSGGILADDANQILREELRESGGYPRILAAVGRGKSRFLEIANEAGQRIEHPLEVLVRADFVRQVLPLGAPGSQIPPGDEPPGAPSRSRVELAVPPSRSRARPIYEIADPYLRFWFAVVYSDLNLIEQGQGRAALERSRPLWQTHVETTFREAARAHVQRLVAVGELPEDLLVGRWWGNRGGPAEIDILGLKGARSWLIGAASWSGERFTGQDLEALETAASAAPEPVDEPTYFLWGQAGASDEVRRAGARVFGPNDVLA